MSEVPAAAVEAASLRIEDILTMLGVNGNEGPEYDEGSKLSTSGETIAQTIARAAIEAATPFMCNVKR